MIALYHPDPKISRKRRAFEREEAEKLSKVVLKSFSSNMDFKVSLCLGFFCFTAFLANFACWKHIRRTYDTTKSLYFILESDTQLTFCLALFEALVFFYWAIEPSPGIFICSCVLINPTSLLTSNCLYLFLSLIRYKRYFRSNFSINSFLKKLRKITKAYNYVIKAGVKKPDTYFAQ